MKVMYCGSCEQERDQLKARIAELELEVAKLKNQIELQGVKYPIGASVVVEKVHPADTLYGPGIVRSFQRHPSWVEYEIALDSGHNVYVPEDELTQL